MIDHAHDTDFKDHIIASISEGKNYWSVTTTESTGFGINKAFKAEPKVGMKVRTYGSFCSPIRGIILDGKILFYRTQAEQNELHSKSVQIDQIKRKRKFTLNRVALRARIKRLPKHFQQRIARFDRNNPDFCWESLDYELFCCEQAVVIAGALSNEERVNGFCKLTWQAQKRTVPGLDDGHSGNTFAVAAGLAALHLKSPKLVISSHGALCALAGCDRYGCISRVTK